MTAGNLKRIRSNPKRIERASFGKVFANLRWALLGLVVSVTLPAMAAPLNSADFTIKKGGFANIRAGAYVEGSAAKGGIQPDYLIDLEAEPLKTLMLEAAALKPLKMDYWEKVRAAMRLVKTFIPRTNYSDEGYLEMLKQHRDSGQDIRLSAYGSCGAGVCREHALLLHFALKAAGIPNSHVYAQIYRASNYHNYQITEDHAFVVVTRASEQWVVDSYYPGFNGYKLSELLSPEGITEQSARSPIAIEMWGTRRIIRINEFPKIYNPKPKTCSRLFSMTFQSPR